MLSSSGLQSWARRRLLVKWQLVNLCRTLGEIKSRKNLWTSTWPCVFRSTSQWVSYVYMRIPVPRFQRLTCPLGALRLHDFVEGEQIRRNVASNIQKLKHRGLGRVCGSPSSLMVFSSSAFHKVFLGFRKHFTTNHPPMPCN